MKNVITMLMVCACVLTTVAQNKVKITEPTPKEVSIGDIVPVTIEYSSAVPVKFQVQINKIGWGLTPSYVQSKEQFPAGQNQKAVINVEVRAKDGEKIVNPKLEYAYTTRMYDANDRKREDSSALAGDFQKYTVDIQSTSKKKKSKKKDKKKKKRKNKN